jgi:hypothetical protein
LLWLTVTVEEFDCSTVLSPTTWPALTVVFTFIVVSPQSLGVCRHYPSALLTRYIPPLVILELLVWLTVTDEVFVWLTVLSPTTWPPLTFVFTFIVVPPHSLGIYRHDPTALLTSHAYALLAANR